jgi:integrase/recombinase XerD
VQAIKFKAKDLARQAPPGAATDRARRDAVLVHVAFHSGARVSELASLRWKDVTDRKGAGKRGGDAVQLTLYGKGSKTRHVRLTSSSRDLLMEHRAAEREAGAGADSDPVFRSSRRGKAGEHRPLGRTQIWRIVERLAVEAHVMEPLAPGQKADPNAKPRVSPHFFRHAHASHALDAGAPVHLVQRVLGHASLETTSRYTHARPQESTDDYLST